ncbi:hypothetical protein GLOIN_2v1885604 [Rhizophagus irregularis DAOM 181602=DAOM 197198]|uniref:Uncharacterized protein n=1 Tax=Rhizophagus irregularis (strain DAOM 181602 / DAOM 197198 / MUCL 43194) TaxID=747089 RepID=A0A2P4P057_RHIID|nr:hypothetical protein GLOIN_2v1885604 [Rhizophagus irregularis DAOM 181602=DAOM 197198]POG58762.1 hypothetical protein GLOIN_2v1885604 [Rhizophagus irregularis DAOM 181602=DAOM 197198]|eukprot:XP_025165628.1 hypothetical protein GLOIN_2v1885604 [Rhizophagus irregularis DAOM 181602=DAOM 197198]
MIEKAEKAGKLKLEYTIIGPTSENTALAAVVKGYQTIYYHLEQKFTITGVDRKLKEKWPNIQIISIDPNGSVLANRDSSVGPYLVNNN